VWPAGFQPAEPVKIQQAGETPTCPTAKTAVPQKTLRAIAELG
jgi:hypothetical protein